MGKDQDLLEAARNGNVPVVEKILSQRAKRSGPLASLRRGPGANVQDNSGYTALHHAALNGHREIVKLLLTHEASTNLADVKGSSPLHLAAWTGNVDIVKLLLCHGPSVPNVNLTTKDSETALHCAAQYGHTAVVTLLLEHSCDPTIRNAREETALDLAAQYGRLETVELLVRTHPELLQPYSRGAKTRVEFPHTPLHLASRNGHKAVVSILLAAGLDVNVRTSGGTALHEAALCGKVEVVRTLLDAGVDLSIRDSQRNTVMDLLGQFPKHVTQDITDIIRNHKLSNSSKDDIEDQEGSGNPLPPIPVPDSSGLGSPYENVRISCRSGHEIDSSSANTSPSHWEFYHQNSQCRENGERVSGTSVMSATSDSGVYHTPPANKPVSLDSSGLSDDLGFFLPTQSRDPDQMSVSSTASSTGGPSPRNRRSDSNDRVSSGVYVPMSGGSGGSHHSHAHSHSPGSNTKVSPTPPKKPPRRNLSVSPTHLQPSLTMSADGSSVCGPGSYEYLFLSRSGVRSQCELEEIHSVNRREALYRQGRSVDQYVEMKPRHSLMAGGEGFHMSRGHSEEGILDDSPSPSGGRKPHLVSQHQPVAITSMYENIPIRTQNPRRKLRRHLNDRAYENFEPGSKPSNVGGNPENKSLTTFVSNAYITLKSSQESLLDDNNKSVPKTPTMDSIVDKRGRKVQITPLSPTHYQQPPTPDHPPPSAIQAEKSIHDRIRPLSQEYKRRSRDMETETEEDLLLFPSLDASSGSLSSSVSLSDKSVSTDNNVEEFLGDVPFAGLFKGSTFQGSEGLPRCSTAERPKTLRRLKNVYENAQIPANDDNDSGMKRPTRGTTGGSGGAGQGGQNQGDKSLSILSPFDEQEEWAKISEIMASFGTGLVRDSVFVSELERELQARLGLGSSAASSPIVGSSVGQWLATMGLSDYESLFINNGFDDLDFINGVLEEHDLKEIGIDNENDQKLIMESLQSLPCKMDEVKTRNDENVESWLKSLHLGCYVDTFHKHLYKDMDRIRRIWEVELTAVLEIHRLGHRKRILVSVSSHRPLHQQGPNLEDINADLNQLKSNIQQLKEEIREKLPQGSNANNTGTLRHSHKKSRPAPPPPTATVSANGPGNGSDLEIRDPSELLVGVPATLTTQWRHRPHVLVTGSVNYLANYLGSTVVKELRGTESTKKSIQKLKKTTKEPKLTPDIVLAISYRGVKFLNPVAQELVCEHEIRNIHCACQDADDLTHFAYITKDHVSKSHYCHVFCVQTMDQATEVILTLGQAFEVAYQMALREQFSTGATRSNGHTRSQSVNQIITISSGSNSSSLITPNHSRSLSVNEIKVNGQEQTADDNNEENSSAQKEATDSTAPESTKTDSPQAPLVQTEEL